MSQIAKMVLNLYLAAVMDNVTYAGIGVIALFVLFILMKPKKRSSDYLLVAINAVFVVLLVGDLWARSDLNALSFLMQNLSGSFALPLFLTYGLLLLGDRDSIRKNAWWYSSYALGFSLFLAIDMGFQSYDAAGLRELYVDPPLYYLIVYKAQNVFLLGAILWFMKCLNRYDSEIKNQYSFVDPIQLKWLRNFSYAYLLINLGIFFSFIVYNIGWIKDIDTAYQLLNGILLIMVFYLSFNGIRQYAQADLVEGTKEEEQKEGEKQKVGEKYKSSSLTEGEMDALYESLMSLFEEKRIYLEPKLQVQDVAKRMGTTTHRVSQTLNMRAGKSYYDFVNGFRVRHLKELLLDPSKKQFTILALGLDSGFNSKASLNRIFKQQTGQSPSEFQRTQVKN